MKIRRAIIFFLVSLLFITGCTRKQGIDSNKDLLIEYKRQIDYSEILEGDNEISEVATPYSVLYKQKNTRTMFVFSKQVREVCDQKYELSKLLFERGADNSYQYRYDNAHVFCMNEEIVFQYDGKTAMIISMTNWKRMDLDELGTKVQYTTTDSKITILPTLGGVEIIVDNDREVNGVSLPVTLTDCRRKNHKAGYVTIENRQKDLYVLHQAVAEYPQKTTYGLETTIQKRNGQLLLECSVENNTDLPRRIRLMIDVASEQMFFDSSVYESFPHVNSIYSNYSYLDNRSELFHGCTYVKLNARSITPKDSAALESFSFSFFIEYVEEPVTLEFYGMTQDWCSWRITWKNKPSTSYKLGECYIDQKGWYTVDLTDYIKYVIDSNYFLLEDNSFMIRVKDETDGYAIMASTDHSSFFPYFEISYNVE